YTSVWSAIWAPKGTPKHVIGKLNAAIVEALADPATRQRLVDLGDQVVPREEQAPERLRALHEAEIDKWWPIIKAANIRAKERAASHTLQRGRFKNETSPPKFSPSRSGRCRAAGRIAHREGASLSDAAGANHRWFPRGRRGRHPRTPDGSMALRTTRSALRHREPARRGHQYRHRGGRECIPRRLHAAFCHRSERPPPRPLSEPQI